jgi:hypothetical protein
MGGRGPRDSGVAGEAILAMPRMRSVVAGEESRRCRGHAKAVFIRRQRFVKKWLERKEDG